MTDQPKPPTGSADRPAQVGRRVALLDEMLIGWDARIDLEYLDVQDYRDRVLGHLFDHSKVAVEMLGLGHDAAACGFEPCEDAPEDDLAWGEIDRAWRRSSLDDEASRPERRALQRGLS